MVISLQVITWGIGLVGVVAFILVGQVKWWGWLIATGGQFIWLAYAGVTGDYRTVVVNLIYSIIFITNGLKWLSENRRYTKREKIREARIDTGPIDFEKPFFNKENTDG